MEDKLYTGNIIEILHDKFKTDERMDEKQALHMLKQHLCKKYGIIWDDIKPDEEIIALETILDLYEKGK